MKVTMEEISDESRFRLLAKTNYNDILSFVITYLKKTSAVTVFLWVVCGASLAMAAYFRITISDIFPDGKLFLHTNLGLVVFPLAIIPIHEALHIVPYYLFGARDIRVGMDLKQFMFYVSAHRYVADARQFIVVALFPFVLISSVLVILVFLLPGVWRWSLSLLLFVHSTACAGDFALINFYFLNRDKEIFTWDDVDKKEAYFFEKL